MESLESLQTFSELSMALVGFAGIVTAIKGVGKTLPGLRRIQMRMLYGQKTHPRQEINSLANLAPVSMPTCTTSALA